MDLLALRVAARFRRLANQPPGAKQRARRLTQPINKPKGIDRNIVKDNGTLMGGHSDVIEADRRDITPKDVFTPTPNNTAVLNLAETGHGLEKAIEKQIPKDKGYDNVNNLSQYLLYTEGGSGDGPQGKKS
jgi:hypothetical protein